MDLGSSYFWPRPNVTSRAVKFVKKELFPQCNDAVLFTKMQRSLFMSRRKTIKNNLSAFLNDAKKAEITLKKAEIDPKVRAETLDIQTLLRLSDKVGEIL